MTAPSERDYADADRLLRHVGSPAALRLRRWIARTKPRNDVVCARCGRVGTRGYVIDSGDTFRCVVLTACERRRRMWGDTP